jgi:hypothetical protein
VLAGGADKIRADPLLLGDTPLDDFQLVPRERPDATARITLAGILGETIGVHVQFHIPALA